MSVRPASGASNECFPRFSGLSLSESQKKHPQQAAKRKRPVGDDRFIPLRAAMDRAKSVETFEMDAPKTLYQKNCVQQIFPYYSERVLLYSQPKKYEFEHQTSKLRWRFPEKEERILDARGAGDNFYMNNLDWGKRLLAVNLGNISYCWKQATDEVSQCFVHTGDLSSLKWSPSGCLLACGDMLSSVHITDVAKQSMFFQLPPHDGAPVYSMDWRSEHELTFGTVGSIYHLDMRTAQPIVWSGNCASIVCSLAWNKDRCLLASGNNANQVQIFDIRTPMERPAHEYSHQSAIKALQWFEGSSHLLLSGGGTADKVIKLYDARGKKMLCEASAGAQITSLTCLDDRYFVLGLGYKEARNIQFWRYLPERNKQVQLVGAVEGQAGRILGVAKNSESTEICSLSDKERLYFWRPVRCSPQPRNDPDPIQMDSLHLPSLIR